MHWWCLGFCLLGLDAPLDQIVGLTEKEHCMGWEN